MTGTPGLLGRLSTETQLHHADADADLERLLTASVSGHAYRDFLTRLHGFIVPLEAAFDSTPRLTEAIEMRARRKAHLLRSDLMTLGLTVDQISRVPICHVIPSRFSTVPSALGWMYVVERSTRLHHFAYRKLVRVLPGELAFASAYLKCYEGTVGGLWESFGYAVDTACNTPAATGQLIGAAREGFRCMRRWHAQAGMSETGFRVAGDRLP